MRITFICLFTLIGLLVFGQTWNTLEFNPNQDGLELNPLKGLTPLYNVDNEFPYSLRGKIVGLDQVMYGYESEDFDWSVFDDFIEEQKALGKFVKLQVNVDMGFNNSDLPQFLKDVGVSHAYYDGQGEGDNQGVPSVVVDYNDENMMIALEKFIEEFGIKYDNEPGVFLVHYGLYGIFGEWGLGSGEVLVPEGEEWAMNEVNQNRIIDAYTAAFSNKKLLARFPDNVPESQLVGYSDGLYFGASISDDPQYSWFFHPRLVNNDADLNWKNHPIGGELDPYLQGTVWNSFPNTVTGDPDLIGENPPQQNTDEVFNITRPTFLFQDWIFNKNNLTQESNPTMWANALEATKKTGYRFHVSEYRITAENNKPAIEVNIINNGIAPMYDNWEVEFGYLGADGSVLPLGSSDSWNISSIQPDVPNNYRSFISAVDIPNGSQTILLRVKNPLEAFSSDAEPVRFANFTQDEHAEGWLTLGEVTITNGNLGQIPVQVSNMFLTPSSASMGLEEQFQLNASVFPGIATNSDVTWSSNKPRTASVDENGLVTSYNKGGEVEITAYSQDGGLEAVAVITIGSYWQLPGLIESENYADVNEAQVGSAPDGESGDQVLGFINDNTWVDYNVKVNTAGEFTVDIRASSPWGVGVLDLLDQAGNLITTINLAPATNGSYDIYGTFSSEPFALPAGEYTLRIDVVTSALNLNWMDFKSTCIDSDFDGICDADDLCPDLDDNLIGTPCDDQDQCTVNDVYTADCGCAGTLQDSDSDGICDADYLCPDLDDNLIGTPCDDQDQCTVNDVYTADCGCAGTLQDSDSDGTCDADDLCPDLDDNLIGTPCDDQDQCTVNDIYTADCGCAGTLQDTDGDGTCDADDLCPDLDDNLIGTPCDDQDQCTVNDVYTADCGCAGTLQDTDGDGTCDADDLCPDLDDNLIGTPCDDQDSSTVNDVYTADCVCQGEAAANLITFELIDADLNQPIGSLKNGDAININEHGWNLNINAITALPAESIRFDLNNQMNYRTENAAPYAMEGNNGGNYHNWNPYETEYTVTATAFSQNNGGGEILGVATINFTVVYEQNSTDNIQFLLVNSDTNTPIRYLNHVDEIDLMDTGSDINIVAEVISTCESVIFSLNEDSNYRTENSAPYALAGDNNGNYQDWSPQEGEYHIKASAFTKNGGNGTVLSKSLILLNVVDSREEIGERTQDYNADEISNTTMQVFPNPFDSEVRIEIERKSKGKGIVSITDLYGKQVFMQEIENLENHNININLDHLPNGVYLVSLIQEKEKLVKKVIKQ